MVLEAVMIVVDNSESSRNGDYQPTRFEAEADAVNIIFQGIKQGNPESSAGLMSMAGRPEVLVTLTTEQGKILDGLHRTRKQGTANLSAGIQIASLALKHRQNKSQRQRIVVFVCSPVEEDEKKLVTLAKKLKKTNVAVDFVLFGDTDDEPTQKKLEAFNKAVKAGDSSHLVTIPPSSKLLSDQLLGTPIISGETPPAGGPADGMGGSGVDSDLGFDPNMDPELALAIRMSLEEDRARQAREAAAREAESRKENRMEAIPEGEGEGEGSSKDKKDEDKKDGQGSGDKMDTT